MKRALNSALFLAVFTLGMGGFLLPKAFAAVNVTASTGGSAISADTNTANGTVAWTTLTGPILTEGATGDITTGTIAFNAPSGFNFQTTANISAVATNTGACNGSGNKPLKISNTINKAAASITITVTQATAGGCKGAITLSGINIRPIAGTPLAAGNITKSGTASVSGVTGSTNFGTLTEVVGAVSASNSTLSASPTSISTDNAAQTTVTVTAKDQFSNPISGRSVVLSSTGTGNTLTQPATTNSSGQTSGTLSSTKAEIKTVSATIAGTAITQTASITFNPGAFDHINITPGGSQSIAGGSTLAFSAQGYDINNNPISGLIYTWVVVAGTGNGTITSGGTLTGGKAGTLTVTATSGAITGSSGTITVTNVAPVLSPIGSKTVNENSALQFAVSGTDANGDAITYSASPLPSGSSFDGATGIFSWTPDYTQSGTYNVNFSASDGILSSSESVAITVNNVNRAPVLNTIGNKTGAENSDLTFTISGSDPDGDALTSSASNLPTGATFDSNTLTFSWTPSFSQSGNYSVLFSVSDGSLSASENVAIDIGNVNLTPSLAPIGSKSVDENSQLTFTISATDADGDALTYSASNLPTGATFDASTKTFSWTPDYTQSGTYTGVHFEVSDGAATDFSDITITVNNVNRAPVLSPIGNKTASEGQNLAFTMSASDLDGNILNYSATGLPSGATLDSNTGAFSWTPDYSQSGNYNVTLKVCDNDPASLCAQENITITVNDINLPPVLSAIGSKSVAENSLLQFTISATDADGDALTYSASNLPTGATFDANTKTFSWTPDYTQSGTYTDVHFEVSDGAASTTEDISINVSNTDRAPILNAIGSKSVDENQLLNFTISASDPDSDTLTYSTTDLPAGATFDSGARTFSWKPGFDQSGNYSVKFNVSDGTLSASENVAIEVINVDQGGGGISGGGSGSLASYNFGPAIASAPIPTPTPAPVQINIEAPKNNPVNVPSQNPQPSTPQQSANPVAVSSSKKPEVNAQNLLASSPELLTPPANSNPSENSSETKTSLFANLSAIMNFNNFSAAVKSGTAAVSRSVMSLLNLLLSLFSGR